MSANRASRRLRHAPAFGLVVAVLAGLLSTQAGAQGNSLKEKIEAALVRLGPHATCAVRVLSLSRGEVLYERNPDLSLNPASNMKLLTSATALAKLGPEYRFNTRVLVTAKAAEDGSVAGDLVLQGGGDPVLETAHLEKLADGLKAAGIRKITGGLIVDDFRYDDERLGNGWNSDDEQYYYSAQISALSVNRNVMSVDISPGKEAGAPVQVQVRPVTDYLRVTACPATGAAGTPTRIRVVRVRGKNEIRVSGTLGVDGSGIRDMPITMEEPELFAGALFRTLLGERGIQIAGPGRRAEAPKEATALASHQSVPLSEIAARLNKPSDNLIAEMLLKELGFACKQAGTAARGSEVVEGWLKELGIHTGGVRVNDGSGLSRLDLVTARAVSDLLVKADAQPWKEAFLHSLPVAGVDGTLRARMKETIAEKNVRAKTGTLMHVTALSGYVTTRKNERLVFSILINNYPGPSSGPTGSKRIEDAIAVALAEAGAAAD
jgi:serine-type D-Ala-D-Ala carboxypeptidase/endopeptidase (penicillin-binding protein 4)